MNDIHIYSFNSCKQLSLYNYFKFSFDVKVIVVRFILIYP